MSGYELIASLVESFASLVGSLALPGAVVWLVYLLRHQIRELLAHVTHIGIEAGGASIRESLTKYTVI